MSKLRDWLAEPAKSLLFTFAIIALMILLWYLGDINAEKRVHAAYLQGLKEAPKTVNVTIYPHSPDEGKKYVNALLPGFAKEVK